MWCRTESLYFFEIEASLLQKCINLMPEYVMDDKFHKSRSIKNELVKDNNFHVAICKYY